jgi:hypothetical protein|tara:strand:+ start:363 stop:551 length:189 start_codon:yes stop_codon:yes gene_type:complete
MKAIIAITSTAAGIALSRYAPGWSIYFIIGLVVLLLVDHLTSSKKETKKSSIGFNKEATKKD